MSSECDNKHEEAKQKQQNNKNMIDLNEQVNSGGNTFVPTDVYTLRCVEAERKISKAKNPMIELKFEIESPDSYVAQDGSVVQIAGVTVRDYLTLVEGEDGKQNLRKLAAVRKQMGLSMQLESLDDVEASEFIGNTVKALVSTKSEAKINEITKQAVKNPDTGEDLVVNYRKVDDYI